MTFIKYFWGFDSSVEGWTGDNVQWENGGKGGLPTPHLYGKKMKFAGGYDITFPVTFKSPRNLSIKKGDIICVIATGDGSVPFISSKAFKGISVEIVDENENIVWSKSIDSASGNINTPFVGIFVAGSDGVGINIKVNIYTRSFATYQSHTHYARIDSVTIYNQPDQVIHTPIPSTLQATVSHEIPINKSGSYIVGALRLDSIKNLATYNEVLIYDGSSNYDYSSKVSVIKTCSNSVDKITITHNADSTLQVYYECDHAVWLLDPNTYRPKWLVLIRCYHNQNVTNPDTVSFSTTLSNTTYTDTQSMSFKFVANGLFKVILTPERDISGDTSGVTKLTATIVVKDVNGNVVGQCSYDILNNSYDNAITIDSSYDNQDLTIEVTINAEGNVSETITVKLKLKISFKH